MTLDLPNCAHGPKWSDIWIRLIKF